MKAEANIYRQRNVTRAGNAHDMYLITHCTGSWCVKALCVSERPEKRWGCCATGDATGDATADGWADRWAMADPKAPGVLTTSTRYSRKAYRQTQTFFPHPRGYSYPFSYIGQLNFSQMDRDHYCGECIYFGNEDIYGTGECMRDIVGRFSTLRYCGEYACDDFENDLNDIEL